MVVKAVKQFVKNNTIIICATVAFMWAIAAAVVLVVTNHSDAIRSLVIALAPVVPSVLTLIGLNEKVRQTKEEIKAVHETITNGDVTDASP